MIEFAEQARQIRDSSDSFRSMIVLPRFIPLIRTLSILFLLTAALPAQEEASPREEPKTSPASVPEAAASPKSSSESAPAALSAAASASPAATATTAAPLLTDVLFKNLKARSIGPAVMGGRVSDIALDPKNPFIFYVGLAQGGVFKTGNNGVSFDPIFDKQPVLSIGAIAVAPSDSDLIWVGTGEANDRNSSGWGNGVYRSTDGGEKWENVGLKESRVIGRIIVDPRKPETAFVAAGGHLWAD